MDIEKILNKRSNAVVTDGGVETPMKPTSSQLDNGEIAVNYHKGTERLFIKNDNEEVVEFVSKDEIDKKQDKVDGVNIVRKEFEDDSGRWTEGVIEIDNGVYNAMVRNNQILFTSGSDKGEIFFEPIGHTIDGKNFPGGVKCKYKKTENPFDNDLRIARMCDLPSVTPQVQSDWNETNTTSKAYILNKPTIPTKTSELTNDSNFLTEHQDISGKADKVSNPTNGNFAALDSNGNLIDSGHKHSDYLTQHQSLTNYVQKSQTAGLLKNDGTVDTNQYLTQHQDISGKANKNEMNVVPGTGVDVDKTTITLKQGMSATVLTTHQDISGKENAMPIATATGETLTAVVGNYYRLDNVGTLAITLPTIVGATKLQAITFMIACGLSALVTFVPQGSETILYQEGFALEKDTTYEVTALWNGSEWTLSRVIYK